MEVAAECWQQQQQQDWKLVPVKDVSFTSDLDLSPLSPLILYSATNLEKKAEPEEDFIAVLGQSGRSFDLTTTNTFIKRYR